MSGYQAGGLYYNEIFPDPLNVDRVYSVDVRTMVTDDGGRTFRPLGERNKHVDNHVVWIDPDDTEHLLIGCDGGLYESFDRGQTYRFFANLPITQFYHVDTDNARPFYRVYGGTQDNFSLGGPSRTRTEHGITNADWFVTAGGDGFVSRADPKDANTVYAESQHGNLQRFNLLTGESINIVPQPEPGDEALRWHWDAPLIISPHANTRLYFASNRVWRSDDRGTSWRAVSADLSRRIDRNRLKMMGRVWSVDAVAKNTSTSFYGNIVAMAESPKKEGLLYVGTDDGLIQMTSDGGKTWQKFEQFQGIPEHTYVTDVTASPRDVNEVFATFNDWNRGNFKPYVMKSTDRGRTWTSIAGDLPDRSGAWSIVQDSANGNLLFAGLEFGLYVTVDGGQHWVELKNGMPTIQVRDVAVQRRDGDLLAGTFGRGVFVLDDYTALRDVSPQTLGEDAHLYPFRDAYQFNELNQVEASWGDTTSPNPPYGALMTYSVGQAPANGTSLVVEITDDAGKQIRRLALEGVPGLHRVAWDLRGEPPAAGRGGAGQGGGGAFFGRGAPQGQVVAQGRYKAQIGTLVGGKVTPIGPAESFLVLPLPRH
jgi:photosystem II stability/assembly factor-like uncharacterized protein